MSHSWQKLQFRIEATRGNARAGVINLNGVEMKTPVFMPVGTKATIKGIFLEMLRSPQYLGELEPLMMILANTYHLYLRPGHELVRSAWGIQQFMQWPWLVLTDSGGFQVFSLGLKAQQSSELKVKNSESKDATSSGGHFKPIKITEDGIKFASPLDGSRHFMSPESCVDIQCALGSDIMMMLDVCSPGGSDERVYARQMAQTHRRATRQYEYYQSIRDDVRGVLFPIVQGGTSLDLRQQSIDYLSPYATDGIAVGGVSVGESREQIQQITAFCWPKLPVNVPRYLMGIGDMETIRFAIESGFDMFDCVMPTRLGRHGTAYHPDGNLNLHNACHRNDHTPLWPEAKNALSRQYTRAYIHHLLRENEMLGWQILSLHNIFVLHQMVGELREGIVSL